MGYTVGKESEDKTSMVNKAWLGHTIYPNGRMIFHVGFTSDTCTLQEFLDWYSESRLVNGDGTLIVISDRELVETNLFGMGEVTRWTVGDYSEV